MPIKIYYNPANPAKQYQTALANDSNVPAGWLDTQGSDGAQPAAVKVYTAGVNNQGAGQVGGVYFDGDPIMRTVQPNWPNGILGATSGNKTIQ